MSNDRGKPTRRELLRAGVAAGAAVGASVVGVVDAAGAAPSDADLLVPIVGSELLGEFTYQRVLESFLMSESAQKVATRMLAQEREHVRRFTDELTRRGGTPPQRITSVTDADAVLVAHGIPNRLSQLRTERDCITVLVRLELLLEGAYFRAIHKFTDPRLIQLSAQAMACEAQHFAVLNEVLRPGNVEKAVPGAYVQGL